jgi:hypothetical protein
MTLPLNKALLRLLPLPPSPHRLNPSQIRREHLNEPRLLLRRQDTQPPLPLPSQNQNPNFSD